MKTFRFVDSTLKFFWFCYVNDHLDVDLRRPTYQLKLFGSFAPVWNCLDRFAKLVKANNSNFFESLCQKAPLSTTPPTAIRERVNERRRVPSFLLFEKSKY